MAPREDIQSRPVPAFHTHPVTADDIATPTAARALEVTAPGIKRWPLPEEEEEKNG